MSMKPGATMSPRASKVASTAPRIPFGGATSATMPSRSSTSIGASSREAGSMTCPPRMSRLRGFLFTLLSSSFSFRFSQGFRQNCHAHGNSVAYFFHDDGLRAVSHVPRELHAANHGAGMHHDGILLGQADASSVHLIAGDVIVHADDLAAQTFLLHAQDHNDVRAVYCVFDGAGEMQTWGERGGEIGQKFHGAA